jgi:glycosyltransferase involved in cell wall biosynthesis
MDLISVIIPVYKAERYLCECVDSVLASTYPNLEVILVDDGSPDSCPQICDAYAVKDNRVKTIHQPNCGLCAARNAGLNIAQGKYIAFVDSDDMVSAFLYEKMIGVIETTNADWVACESTRTYNTLLQETAPSTGKIRVLKGMEQQLAVLVCAPVIRGITWTSGYVWNKLYRKELISQPFMLGCLNAEDLQFNWEYIHNSRTLAILPCSLYYYRINEESITETYRKATSDRIAERGISLAQTFVNIANQNPTECKTLTPYLIARAVHALHGALFRIYAHNLSCENLDFVVDARKYIRQNWRYVWIQKDTYSFVSRLSVALFTFAYPLWRISTKILKNKLK